MRVAKFVVSAGLGLWLAACGASTEATETPERTATAGDERPAERDDGSEITGLLGTIRPDQVNNALEPRTNQFFACLEPRMSEVRFLGGEVRLSFRIHVDGTVAWVYPSQSTLGDRHAERCILEVASRARFPQPRGGEAEFSWGFAFDPPDDVRAPIAWEATYVGPALLSGAPELAQRCGVRGARVTAYVAPGGRVIAAGASSPDVDSLSALDCVIDAVQGLAMPDPGSYAAKVTFLVQ